MWQGEDAWLEGLYQDAIASHKNHAASQTAEERRQTLLQALREMLGEFEPNQSFTPTVIERVECDGYIRERVELSAAAGLTFAAYVLLPKDADRPIPGVLALHGHGYGSREVVGLLPDGTPDDGEPGIHQHFALQLVKRGLAVIAPAVIGFGERRLEADLAENPDAPNSCNRLATQLLMLGKSLTGLRVFEARKALDYLISRPEVARDHIGAMGFSGGALIANTVAALDDRVQALVLTGFTNTFRDSILAVHHCIDNYTPGMLQVAELPEFISLFAPKPLFLESGSEDPIFPKEGFERAVHRIREAYKERGAEERLRIDLFPGGHGISGRYAYDWLKDVLTKS